MKQHLDTLKLSKFWKELLCLDDDSNSIICNNAANALTLLTATCMQDLQSAESVKASEFVGNRSLIGELINKINYIQEYAFEDMKLREENEQLRHALHMKATELEIATENQMNIGRSYEQIAMEIEEYQSRARLYLCLCGCFNVGNIIIKSI